MAASDGMATSDGADHTPPTPLKPPPAPLTSPPAPLMSPPGTAPPQTDPATRRPARDGGRRASAVIAIACAGQFLVVLDVSVVNVALPSLKTGLGLSDGGLQWVLNAYAIAFAGFMLLGGRAADLFGHKRVFLVGLGLFTAASVAGGLAETDWQLLAARVVQGLGAAVLSPTTLTIVMSAVPPGPARLRAVATWSAVGAGGGAAGGLVGGVLTDLLSWRWVLLINAPIGVLVLVAAVLCLRESRTAGGRRLDLTGAVLVTAGSAAIAYGVVQSERTGWTGAAAIGALLAGTLLLAAFVTDQARAREPLMPLRIFRSRAVSAANAGVFVLGSASFASWFFVTVYAQGVLGYSPLEAGLALAPSALSIVLGSKAAPRLMSLLGMRSTAVLGTVVAGVGYVLQSLMTADGSYATTLLGPGIVMMTGMGVALTPLAALATSGVDAADAGLASGMVNMSRTMGGALGLAVLSTIAAARTAGSGTAQDLTSGYALAFRTASMVLLAGAALMCVWLPRPSKTPDV
ncbi:MFS transporter [Streptomyces sp. NPDC026672]|uniref:MFS transporter n=1 Tax=unclassified Streptomyces TaxID=2593676 RepID=UPI0033E967FD